jgi:hypothetical protein
MRHRFSMVVLLALGCSFNPSLPPLSVYCTDLQPCSTGQRCVPIDGGHSACCSLADCPLAPDAGAAPTDAVVVEGTISSVGGIVSLPASGISVHDDGFETTEPCAGPICVTGGISP